MPYSEERSKAQRNRGQPERYMSIASLPSHKHKSAEEMRYEDMAKKPANPQAANPRYKWSV